MRINSTKKVAAGVACALLFTGVNVPVQSQAAAKVKLSSTNMTLKVGETKKLQLKKVSVKNSDKIKWTNSDKSVVTLKKIKKNNSIVKLAGKAEGKASIKAKYAGKTYSCKVKVKSGDNNNSANPTPQIIYVETTPKPGTASQVVSTASASATATPQIVYVETTPKPAEEVKVPQGNLTYQSDVTYDMTKASYWIDRCSEPDKILATPEDIKRINKEAMNNKGENGTFMNDLLNMSDTYNATQRKNGLATALIEEVQKGRVGDNHDIYLDGKLVEDKEAFFAEIKKNIEDAVTVDEAKVKYALCTRAAELKMAPVEGFVGWSATDTDEEFMDSRLNVNEPFVVEAVTADGKFYWGRTVNCTGWALADHFAICDSKEEWADMWTRSGEDILVVTQDHITLAPSAYDTALDGLELQFATVLPLVPKADIPENIDDRGTWYNYVVYVPTRDENGRFVRSMALVGMNNKVSVGYLPLTKRNILNVAFNCLGNRYGWGGMMGLMDCSLFTRDIYKCFGYELPRNTTWQVRLPEDYVTALTEMTEEEKKTKVAAMEPGTLLMFSGHITMYIGSVDGKQYVISDVGSAAETAAYNADAKVQSIFSVAVNSLDIRRRNGNTWLAELKYAVQPWK